MGSVSGESSSPDQGENCGSLVRVRELGFWFEFGEAEL